MTYLPDLTPCTYVAQCDRVVAVGWLDSPHDYSRGVVESSTVDVMRSLVKSIWEPGHFMGYHTCSLCDAPETPVMMLHKGDRLCLGASNLWIPADGRIFVAPSLVLHYVADHGYLPPREFLTAARKCPPPGSRRFMKLIARWGPLEFRSYVDPRLCRIVDRLREARSVSDHPNAAAPVRAFLREIRATRRVLGRSSQIDGAFRDLARRIEPLIPANPEPDGAFPFEDKWRAIREEIEQALEFAFDDQFSAA